MSNIILLRLSYYYSRVTRKPHVWGQPFAAAVEPVNFCNLACPECFAGNGTLTRDKNTLGVAEFKKIIDRLPDQITYLTLYFQGEPLLHPQFHKLVELTHQKGIFVSTSTNGHFFNNLEKVCQLVKSGLDRIIISVDGTTQEVYQQYRKNGNLPKVIEGIKNIVDIKKKLNSKTPYIEIQFLVMKQNEAQIHEMEALAKTLKVDKLAFKTVQVYDFENDNELIPENKRYSRYTKKGGKYQLKTRLGNYCWRQWSSVVITSVGDVIPCCFDKNADYSFGNILHEPFSEIWQNEKNNIFRKQILTNRKQIEMCNNCTSK